jgi:hypothetical protein
MFSIFQTGQKGFRSPRPSSGQWRGVSRPTRWIFLLALACLGGLSAQAQIRVETLGGGRIDPDGPDAGYVDGDLLQASQFHSPLGMVADADGNLFIADFGNNAIRRIRLLASTVNTFIPKLNQTPNPLNQPVAVALNGRGGLFVLQRGGSSSAGAILEFDSFANLAAVRASGLNEPTAFALDRNTNFFVAELAGVVRRVDFATGAKSEFFAFAPGTTQLRGIAFLDNGNLAVSDAQQHAIHVINTVDKTTTILAGGKGAGFTDGPAEFAQFNQPQHLAKAPNGSLIVADRMNHRTRIVTLRGHASTLHGLDPSLWASDFPGWEDGEVTIAEAREPVGVTIGLNNTVFTTELFYHLIRQITGADLTAPPPGGGGGGDGGQTNAVVARPIINPSSGFFPMGVRIQVTSTDAFGPDTKIFYTTDASEPTTNSFQVTFSGNVGEIFWRDGMRDLTSLRVKAFSGTNSSATVSGTASNNNEVGISTDITAGIGANAIVPVVVNLRPGQELRSLQFVAEVTPNGSAPVISDPFRQLPISTNDFVAIRAASTSVLSTAAVLDGSTVKLPIAYVGTNAVFTVNSFAVVAMLALPIPVTAQEGQTYSITVSAPSGTSDGQQTPVTLSIMPARTVRVQNIPYLVGDSSPGAWYNAGDFGNGNLDNSDVNNAFYASLGVRVPYTSSDAFDAMDAFPEDTPTSVGGDRAIRFLDWQTILRRSLRLTSANYTRVWSPGGVRIPMQTNLPTALSVAAESQTALPGSVWVREAALIASPIGPVQPGTAVDIPIDLEVRHGYSVAGLSFRAEISPDGSGAPVGENLQFIPAPGISSPVQGLAPGANVLLCGWSIGSFTAPLKGTVRLGSIRVRIPSSAVVSQKYRLAFAFADGAPDYQTEYHFETFPASIAVLSPAPAAETISDEWKQQFFNTTSISPSDDADGDGLSNAAEFQAGTHPADASSRLALKVAEVRGNSGARSVVMRWMSAPGKRYTLETSADFISASWKPVATQISGTGAELEFVETNVTGRAQFFRIRLDP